MLNDVVKDLPNVRIETFGGLLVDFAEGKNVNVLVRGLREADDFSDELRMAQGNKAASGGNLETVFLGTDSEYSYLSSSMVREFVSYGRICEGFVPKDVANRLREKLK